MQGKKIRLIGGLLVAAALALATVSATAAQTQPAPGSRGMMGGNGPGLGTGMMGGYGLLVVPAVGRGVAAVRRAEELELLLKTPSRKH